MLNLQISWLPEKPLQAVTDLRLILCPLSPRCAIASIKTARNDSTQEWHVYYSLADQERASRCGSLPVLGVSTYDGMYDSMTLLSYWHDIFDILSLSHMDLRHLAGCDNP